MSRAFVKEDDDAPDEPLPERQVSEHPNYVTPSGLAQLVKRVEELEAERLGLARRDGGDDDSTIDRLRHAERDLRYYRRRLETAVVIDPRREAVDALAAAARETPGVVAFGTVVTVDDGSGPPRRYTIVGEDEADPDAGLVSWVSPLAKVLDGARVGDRVVWRRPAGTLELVVVAVGYKEGPVEQRNGTS